MTMNLYGNVEDGPEWKCLNCGRGDIGEAEMCECWDNHSDIECDVCGNVWDGNAQCTCLMLGEVSDDDESLADDSLMDTNKNYDSMSTSSDASDLLEEFVESGHIAMNTSRDSIQQMLAVARSQEDSNEEPEWMETGCDSVDAGNFTPDGHFVPHNTDKSKREIMQEYPTLTESEHDEMYALLDNIPVVDIVDSINMKRLREYDTERVYRHHFHPCGCPPLQLVKRVVE